MLKFFRSKNVLRTALIAGSGICAVLVILAAFVVRIDYHRHCEGVYFLTRETGYRQPYELTDDVVLGEEDRVIGGFSWDAIYDRVGTREVEAYGEPVLDYEWYARDGEGFIRNIYPDGRQLLTCLSRFKDSDGKIPKGIFVGGGLPYHEHGDKAVSMNDTGMAYYDGEKWQHLWCNVNESIAIATEAGAGKVISPSQWEFLGSRVVEADKKRVVLQSRHRVLDQGVELRLNRYAIFRAGEPYFILVNQVWNSGGAPASYYYVYGDEPWLGNFGTSAGNVGWVKDRLFSYEGQLELNKYSWFGMADVGNKAINEPGTYTGIADFIEWLGVKPDLAYFSNTIGSFAQEKQKVPLASPDNRVLFLQWGPRLLQPGQLDVNILAIGMTWTSPTMGVPVKPQVQFDYNEFVSLLARKGLT